MNTTMNTKPGKELDKFVCDNCAGNELENNKCTHCGTQYFKKQPTVLVESDVVVGFPSSYAGDSPHFIIPNVPKEDLEVLYE